MGLQKIQSEQDVKKLILVAHGAIINTILAVISNNEIGSGKTVLTNASISTIQFIDGNWHILNYNQVNHLVINEFSPYYHNLKGIMKYLSPFLRYERRN
ncbi:MAG: histidine phosphatase family protein [Rummeliibacillus sp.]